MGTCCRPRAANVDVSPSPTAAVWRRRPTKSMFQVLAPSARASRPAAAAARPWLSSCRLAAVSFHPIHPSRSGHTPFCHPSIIPRSFLSVPVPNKIINASHPRGLHSFVSFSLPSVLSDFGIFPVVLFVTCLSGTPIHPPSPVFAASVCVCLRLLRLACVSCVCSLSAASQHRWLALTLPHRHTPVPSSTHSAADPALPCCRVHAAAHVEPTAAAHRPGPRLRPRPRSPTRPRTCCCASLPFILKHPLVASERLRPRSLSSPFPGSPILAASTLFQPNPLLFDTACCVLLAPANTPNRHPTETTGKQEPCR